MADVGARLTSHHEGYGRVIVESFLAGVPVVSTRSGGPEDILRTGVDGFLTSTPRRNSPTPDQVCPAVPEEEATRMGRAGQRRMREEFSLEVLVPRLIGCWVKAVGSERKPDGQNIAQAAGNEIGS